MRRWKASTGLSFSKKTRLKRSYRAIAPDVLVKGADYKPDDLPGAEFIRSRGGEIIIAPLQPGFSTTALVEKMKADAKR